MQNTASLQRCPASEKHVREFVAPARVNLLGEHTDYTGGFVMPMAIDFSTTASLSPREDGRYSFASERFADRLELGAHDRPATSGAWSDYPLGVLSVLRDRGIQPSGFDLCLRGDVPLGAGLSSSASIEVASAMAMLAHAGVTLPAEEIAALCHRAENEFVHSPCGIMDQFVITAAQAGHALLLDTRALSYELIPLNSKACVVVCNSMVKHSIATGEYGVRRHQVEAGQDILCTVFPHMGSLRDATMRELDSCRSAMSTESFARCRHILTENARVLEAKQAMQNGDNGRFGELMLAAHASQRDDFACSCQEIDFLVDTAATLDGCFGARMTGGGFGGCTVNLVEQEKAGRFAAQLRDRYRDRFNIEAETYLCEPVDGAMLRNTRERDGRGDMHDR